MTEIWKDIEGYNGWFQISNKGNVRSWIKCNRRTGEYSKRKEPNRLSKRKNSQGYLRAALHFKGNRKRYFVHRLVAKAFIPNPKNKPEINHIDGNPLNNNVDNLEWCTSSENKYHAYENGLSYASPMRGADNGCAKLSESDVRSIRKHADSRGRYYGREELANEYNVSENTIKDVVNRRSYKNV